MNIVEFRSGDALVKGYIHDDYETLMHHKIRPALIVCPGGGYRYTSPREKDPPALSFFSIGYNVFILDYSVLEKAGGYRPLRELAAAVCTVRARSGEWHIDPTRVAVMGFSAGGHLAASLGALWDDSELHLPDGCRPDALVLCCPVITMGEYTNAATQDNITGGKEELCRRLSVETRIGPGMPQTFIWHTVDDTSVPVENTLLLINALRRFRIPFECHLFTHGKHGLSVCTQEVETPDPACGEWVTLCKSWLNERFGYAP